MSVLANYALTMHAFDFILVLFSFVYGAAVTRHRLQAYPAIVVQCGLDVSRAALRLRVVDRPMGFTRSHLLGHRVDRVLFLDGGGIYLNARLVSPRIPERGEIDLQRFHSEEGRKYLVPCLLRRSYVECFKHSSVSRDEPLGAKSEPD